MLPELMNLFTKESGDAHDVCVRIRHDPKTKHIPVVMRTKLIRSARSLPDLGVR